MKKGIIGAIAGMGIVGILMLVFAPLALTIYGLYLAFSASIVLGVLALLIEPSPFILGVLALFGHPDVATKIATWLGL